MKVAKRSNKSEWWFGDQAIVKLSCVLSYFQNHRLPIKIGHPLSKNVCVFQMCAGENA
jgi:hypothetical protein